MNRTGDMYMNRIALAVKSALGLVMLAPPGTGVTRSGTDAALEEIVVTGYRKSVEASLEAKRDATGLVDVVTADDIGKMPDKNVCRLLGSRAGCHDQRCRRQTKAASTKTTASACAARTPASPRP